MDSLVNEVKNNRIILLAGYKRSMNGLIFCSIFHETKATINQIKCQLCPQNDEQNHIKRDTHCLLFQFMDGSIAFTSGKNCLKKLPK